MAIERWDAHGWSGRWRWLGWRLLNVLLLVGLLGADVARAAPHLVEPPSRPAPETTRPPTDSTAPASSAPAAARPDVRRLPPDLAGLPELVEQRTANSAVFRLDDRRYAAIVSAGPLHYRDDSGQWQIIDPTFRPAETGFEVRQNSIRSRAGHQRAWLSAAAGEAIVNWRAATLNAVTRDTVDSVTLLAQSLASDTPPAKQLDQGRRLHYPGGWSDPTLAEEIISAPGSVEHLLVLAEPPQAISPAPDFLELEATLKLLPETTLWANGQPQAGPFQTSGSLEIRNAAGEVQLVFDPVLAFEQARPNVAVRGQYVARPGDAPGVWTVGLRTPWRWWASPHRRYPAVIDPTMHVLRTTGFNNGIAWVGNGNSSNPDTQNKDFQFSQMILGSFASVDSYRGYVQFNAIPYLLTNAPIAIDKAWLDIEPTGVIMPAYTWSGDGVIDWEFEWTQHDVTLYDLGQCPAGCGGFSLRTAPTGFTWDNAPTGASLGAKPVAGPPPKNPVKSAITSWDVTSRLQSYNQQTPRPSDGPAFMLQAATSCPFAFSQFIGGFASFIPDCTRLVIPPTQARLRLEYTALPITQGQSTFLNQPGVPSFYENIFEETNHQYDLAIQAGPDRWRAVAVRGNHAIDPAIPTRTGLQIIDYTDSQNPQLLASGMVQGPDETAYVLLDDHTSAATFIGAADLRAEVAAADQNDFASDGSRNYRVQYVGASDITLTYGVWITETLFFKTDRLVELREFALNAGDNALLRVTAPVTLELDLAVSAPTNGAAKNAATVSNLEVDRSFQPEGQPVRTKILSNVSGGDYALALVNQGRPIPDPDRPQEGVSLPVTVEILACPQGTFPTAKYKCQPLRLPDTSVPDSRAGLGLTVYSEGGFTATGTSWCTQNESQGAPVIGPDSSGRWLFVVQGTVCRSGNTLTTTIESALGLGIVLPGTPSTDLRGKIPMALVYGNPGIYPVPAGYPTGEVTRTGDSGRLEPLPAAQRNIRPFYEYWGDVTSGSFEFISTTAMQYTAEDVVAASVTIDANAAAKALTWTVPWQFYPDEASTFDYRFTPQPNQSPALASPEILASLQLRVLNGSGAATGIIDTLDSYVLETTINAGQFRAGQAKITQDPKLGGATKNAQVVVQPPGMNRLPANQKSCSFGGALTSCLDLRRDDYAWGNGLGDKPVLAWELPDIHIVDSLGTMAFSQPGQMQIFSSDHPLTAANVSESFSFDTWGATVEVKEEACTPGGPIVTVVRGATAVALPMVGSDGSSGPPYVEAQFKLCDAELRQTKLTLDIAPANLPIGSSGLGAHLISGEVIIDPDFTQITFLLGMESLDKSTLTNGVGNVTIDTRGLFALQAQADIVGTLDANLLLQIAWNPMDVLVEAGVSCCAVISGQLRMHSWIGQGWQNKYNWLPNNDDFHFAGSIQATVSIPSGYIGDIGIAELPPFNISLGVKIAFGEFCTNASCTSYAWGLSAVVTIVGYDIGIYVDTSGLEFILGSDDHVLIDQFQGLGGQSQPLTLVSPQAWPAPQVSLPGNWQPFVIKTAKTPVDDWPHEEAANVCAGTNTAVHTCPFTVSPGAGRALFMAGWQNGSLDVALIKPDNTVITAGNAAAQGVVISQATTSTAQQTTFSVVAPGGNTIPAGVWQVQLSNVGQGLPSGFDNNYQLLFATDPPAPVIAWSEPNSSGEAGTGSFNLQWSALRAGQPLTAGAKIELFYVDAAQKPATPAVFTGTLIANRLPANQGSYTWDTSGLASGEYAVGARIDDRFNGNGAVVAWADGTVLINDTTPPPAPNITGQVDLKDALMVLWQRDNSTRDLAGYLVEYTIPDWDVGAPQLARVRRLLPHSPKDAPLWERVRLGGLLTGQPTTVCVRAYDASGNVSGCSPFTHTPRTPPRPLGAPPRLDAVVNRDPFSGSPRLDLTWAAPGGSPTGYLVSYALAGCVLPNASTLANEGPSPIDVGNTLSFSLTGLTVGQWYLIKVKAYNAQGFVGPAISKLVVFASPTDGDSDGLSDQWAAVYGVSNGGGDADLDTVTNGDEFNLGSNPLLADSDGDGYDDGEEVAWGTDLCGSEHPPYHTGPKLILMVTDPLNFVTPVNQSSNLTKTIHIFNFGGGALDWLASGSAPWITLSQNSGSGNTALAVGIDPNGLSPGRYQGGIAIRQGGGSNAAAVQESATLSVTLQVLPEKATGNAYYLPVIVNQSTP